jgi:proline racemase
LGTLRTPKLIRTIDAHVAGEPLRLVVDGFPSPRGRTMAAKREWIERHAEDLRQSVLLEPRGHRDMSGAILTEPVSPGSHAGILFMDYAGCPAMSGHGIIAAATIALERRLIVLSGDAASLVFDTPAGTIHARATFSASDAAESKEAQDVSVRRVAFLGVPSFVLHGGLLVSTSQRQVRVDVAYGGAFYAIVDGEAVGLPLDAAHLPELRRTGAAIARAAELASAAVHPIDASLNGVAGTIFTGPASDERAALRSVVVTADGQVDRSPSGTGTAAVMAVLDAMGMIGPDMPFVQESIIGTHLAGRIAERTAVGDYQAIVTEIEGTAWITGEHTFVIDDDDPLKTGFQV